MAKVPFSKFGLKYIDHAIPVQFKGQTVAVMQYLPIQDKLDLISKIIEAAHDDAVNYANPIKTDVFTDLFILEYYTDISFTEKQKENAPKLYDLCAQNGLIATIKQAIPQDELEIIYNGVARCSKAVYDYQTSVLGIMDAIGIEAKDLNGNAQEIYDKLANPDNLNLLRDVMDKMG